MVAGIELGPDMSLYRCNGSSEGPRNGGKDDGNQAHEMAHRAALSMVENKKGPPKRTRILRAKTTAGKREHPTPTAPQTTRQLGVL